MAKMQTKVENIEEQLKKFLTKQFLFDFDENSVTSKTDLFEAGLIDSFGTVELVGFIEKKFEIKLTDEELTSGSLKSLSSMVNLIEGKLKNAC